MLSASEEKQLAIEGRLARLNGKALLTALPLVVILIGWGVSVEVRLASTCTSSAAAVITERMAQAEERLVALQASGASHRHQEFDAVARLDERLKALAEQMAGVRRGIDEVHTLLLGSSAPGRSGHGGRP